MTEHISASGILAARQQGWPGVMAEFRKKVHPQLVKTKPGRGNPEYVPHSTCRQYLHLAFDYCTIKTAEVIKKAEDSYAVRCVLVCELDGERREFEGWGESDNAGNPLKSAESDAFKRICGMDLGIGLELWAREHYFLDKVSAAPVAVNEAGVTEGEAVAPAPTTDEAVENVKDVLDAEEKPASDDAIRAEFMVLCRKMNVEYEDRVKPYMLATMGASWSGLSRQKRLDLLRVLKHGDGKRDDVECREAFREAVVQHGR